MEPGRPPLYGALMTSTPRRLGDLHSVATKISILQQRPEDLRRPGKLHPTATCRPAPAATRTLPPPRPRRRTGDVGDLDISPLRRRGYLPCVVTCMPLFCYNMETSILRRHGHHHHPHHPHHHTPHLPQHRSVATWKSSSCGNLVLRPLRRH